MLSLLSYVKQAFRAVNVISTEEDIQHDIEAFVQRWGGVDLVTFANVLQQARNEEMHNSGGNTRKPLPML